MNVILCAYNWCGCKALELLLDRGYNVFVYTHENPAHIPSLIDLCIKRKINYSIDPINESNLPFIPDVITSVYYRYIIGTNVINLTKGKIFNLHPSLLPQYRGCSSLTWAMINNESFVGFSYHYINKGIDTGNIILQKDIKLEEFDTQQSIYYRAMFESMKYYLEAFDYVLNGKEGISQKTENTLYYGRGCPYNGLIDEKWSIDKIERFIRAMNNPPLPYARFKNKEVKTLSEFKELLIKEE